MCVCAVIQPSHLQEKLASYEVNDPFIHHLVGKIQSTLDDIKVSSLSSPALYQSVCVCVCVFTCVCGHVEWVS